MVRGKSHRHDVHVSWCLDLNGGLSKWYVAKVTERACMFLGASAFSGGLIMWYVARVTDMTRMFPGSSAFNDDLSKWYVAKVTDMTCML